MDGTVAGFDFEVAERELATERDEPKSLNWGLIISVAGCLVFWAAVAAGVVALL